MCCKILICSTFFISLKLIVIIKKRRVFDCCLGENNEVEIKLIHSCFFFSSFFFSIDFYVWGCSFFHGWLLDGFHVTSNDDVCFDFFNIWSHVWHARKCGRWVKMVWKGENIYRSDLRGNRTKTDYTLKVLNFAGRVQIREI